MFDQTSLSVQTIREREEGDMGRVCVDVSVYWLMAVLVPFWHRGKRV